MRTLKVISNGNPHGTTVVDAETGERFAGVVSLDLHLDLNGVKATFVCEHIPLEVVADGLRRYELTNEDRS